MRNTREARSIYVASMGAQSTPVLNTYRIEGKAHLYAARTEAAVVAFERALALQERVKPGHPVHHAIAYDLSVALLDLGDPQRVLALTSQYFADSTSFEGVDEETRLGLTVNHASALLDQGRARETIDLTRAALERARAREEVSSAALEVAEAVEHQAQWALASSRDAPQLRARIETFVEGLDPNQHENGVVLRRFSSWLEETA